MSSRRNFLQSTALLAGGLPLLSFKGDGNMAQAPQGKQLELGVAGYTFRHYTMEESIAIMSKLGIKQLSIKDFHLPLNSTQVHIDAVKERFKEAGIIIYTVGVIYMKTKEEVDLAFEYAKKVGVNMIVGVPNYELLDYAEEKVKEFNIKLAIHNHGPEDKLYPAAKDIYDRILKRDKRMGLCLDIGHAVRAGEDLPKAVRSYADRLFDLHIKDVTVGSDQGKAIEAGRGVIDFPALVKALRKINYQGYCGMEYEKDMQDIVSGLSESVGFIRGIMKY